MLYYGSNVGFWTTDPFPARITAAQGLGDVRQTSLGSVEATLTGDVSRIISVHITWHVEDSFDRFFNRTISQSTGAFTQGFTHAWALSGLQTGTGVTVTINLDTGNHESASGIIIY